MSPELIRLHISQLNRTFEKSKANKYGDKRKEAYHIKLNDLFQLILKEDLASYDYEKQKNMKEILDFIFLSVEFLDNSTLTNIPHEIVFCLEKALEDWDDTNAYIIVTSLNNDITGYSFNPKLALSPHYYDIIDALFNISFECRLIQINLPRYLVHDYLANVVLYHELGHFIERKFKIAERLTIINRNSGQLTSTNDELKFFFHTSEFFADVFAAQYIGEASNQYLNYIAHKVGNSETHPSTDSRIKLVKDFLGRKTDNAILNEIMEATKRTTQVELCIRSKSVDNKDFMRFIPLKIDNVDELHSVFYIGWSLWISDIETYNKNGIKDIEKYQIINNLIEKSVSNYMILEQWNK